jgi:hypothetical protein
MRRLLKVLAVIVLFTIFTVSPALALVPLPPTVPTGVTPQWAPVPGSHGVEYATNLKVDLFRYRGLYYYWVAGGWRSGQTPRGPWRPVRELPAAIRSLDPGRFKSVLKPQPWP